MNKSILKTGPQEFIKNNWNTDSLSVLLKKPIFQGISQKALVEQLEAKQRCQTKLPTWFQTSDIYYPNKRNVEQTSSETTAEYKSHLLDGKSVLDLTGGLGVDSYYFSKKMKRVTHCEMDENLSRIATHNFAVMGVTNAEFVAEDGLAFLKDSTEQFDWIYVDPSRRHNVKGKVFRLEDCLPNIPENVELLFKHCDSILIKASPLLDLTLGISVLKNVAEIHVVALNNEVKELLFILKKNTEKPILVTTVNLKKEDSEYFEFNWEDEKEAAIVIERPQNYLYEPNAAILKAGAFKSIATRFRVGKIAPRSHLYTSNELIDFPGRRFTIEAILPYSKKNMKLLMGTKANVSIRNFPETVAQIRKKYKIADGGEDYLFFTTAPERNLWVLRCRKG